MAGAELDWAVRRPHPALHALVSRYIGYRQDGVLLEVHRGLPSQHVTLIISLEAPIRLLGMPGSDQRPARCQGFVGGLHTGPALIAQDRVQAGIHLEVSPLGVRTLLGVSASELSGRVLDLADLPHAELVELPERLVNAPSWASRFEILDQVLLRRAAHAATYHPPGEVRWAWREILRAGGTVPVTRLAAEVGWSRRHFSEQFARELGLAPKQAARVVRFGRAAELLRRLPPGGLAEVALVCGYFDQAHLTNEWRALAGCSPGTWIAEELPFLQDGEVSTGAG
ncbi:MAG TPA: helix-turn-helix domain-containing protein [Pseudonocardia sp.]|uniref:AraC family transcriptional regulator n=1 Tax=Pseudonocardia sp. TaxID=60912 RepID=UPI002C866BF2|nr:helix-turn-helix domain-containing protein [Pseudonocardia sp.]HTF46630.1 helix-turn-helix domain-containing protein [Pseudonocardia sp.]